MKTFSKFSMVTALIACVTLALAGTAMAATAPNLGSVGDYAIYSDAGVTNFGGVTTTYIWGSVGHNDFGATNLATPAQVVGTIGFGTGVATVMNTAYLAMLAQGTDPSFNNLAGTNTVEPGVYDVASTTLNGTLTLSGAGVYIFKGAAVTVTAPANMVLTNGADACNVFRALTTSMHVGAGAAHVIGTVITAVGGADITFGDGASLTGRAWAHTAITLRNNVIGEPTCNAPTPGTGTLHVIKTVVNGGPLVAADFILTINSGGVFYTSGVGSAGTAYSLPEGTYTVSEPVNASYTDTYTNTYAPLLLDCSNIVIASGSDETCTILNTYITPTPPSGGGGGSSILVDVCPNGDYSTSYYDGICGVIPAAASQSIHIVKIANRLIPFPVGGGDVLYTYAVTNPSNTSISNVVVSDDKCSPLTSIGGDMDNDNLLDTTEVWTYTCSDTISVTTRNVATVTGRANGVTVSDTDFANVVVGTPEAPVVTPKLPKTGLFTEEKNISWSIAILGGMFLILSISFVSVLRKRNV